MQDKQGKQDVLLVVHPERCTYSGADVFSWDRWEDAHALIDELQAWVGGVLLISRRTKDKSVIDTTGTLKHAYVARIKARKSGFFGGAVFSYTRDIQSALHGLMDDLGIRPDRCRFQVTGAWGAGIGTGSPIDAAMDAVNAPATKRRTAL